MTNELCERRLSDAPVGDFLEAVAATWQDPKKALPGGESNIAAQSRGVTLVERLCRRYPDGCVVLSTHGNLLALVLQHYDPAIDFDFWNALTMPDIYCLVIEGSHFEISRVWDRT
jgi:2,3-bisphosphoglycerate-dependent phosphoglycerate mutase